MFNQLFAVIAPILVCAGLGYGWARMGINYPVDFVTRLVMNIGAPCLIFSSFSKAGIDIGKMAELSAATVLILLIMLVLGALLIRLMRLDIGLFCRRCYFRISATWVCHLCLFAFGETGLALGLTVFLVIFALADVTRYPAGGGTRQPGRSAKATGALGNRHCRAAGRSR